MSAVGAFALPKRAIAPRLGAAILFAVHLAMVYMLMFSLFAGEASWLAVIALPMNMLCAWHRAWQLGWFTQVKRANDELAAKSRIDHKLFMPYATCPKCNTEELHWIATTTQARAAGIHRQKHDLFRECRNCGHIWSQKVGA